MPLLYPILYGLASISLLFALFFSIATLVGYFRFSDIYTRVHALSILDVTVTFFVLFSLLLFSPTLVIAFKICFLYFLLMVSSPVLCQAFVQTALIGGVKPTCAKEISL